MMSWFLTTSLTVILLLIVTSEAQFPKDPKPCPYGDGECIKKIMTYLIEEKADGYEPLNLGRINPLKVSEIHIPKNKGNSVNIDLKFFNSELFGLENCTVMSVKGFGKDMTAKNEVVVKTDRLTLYGDYIINGQVLILPIVGSGKSNITLVNGRIKGIVRGEPVEKNGETYLHIKEVKIIIDPKRLYIDFTNLFNGNKELGDVTNKFLNENWKDIFGEMKGSIANALGMVIKRILNAVFDKYPYEKLFATE